MVRGGGRKRGRATDPFRFDRGLLAEAGSTGRAFQARLAGVDEAGRGCLAGPLVAAAVVLDYAAAPFAGLEKLTDSKLLTPAAREGLYEVVLCRAVRVSWVARSSATIDQVGLHRCNLAALAEAL
jgi:ribonuclease HII